MSANVVKVLLIAATVSVLSACSGGGLTTTGCFSSDCQSPQGRDTNTLKFGGSNIGNSFNQYSSGLMQAD